MVGIAARLVAIIAALSVIQGQTTSAEGSGSPKVRGSIYELFCRHTIVVPIGISGYPVAEEVIGKGRDLTISVGYSARGAGNKEGPWWLGVRVDRENPIGIATAIIGKQRISLHFPALSPGNHAIAIGFLNPSGALVFGQRYCVQVPNDGIWRL
jgi:hypothetical protein